MVLKQVVEHSNSFDKTNRVGKNTAYNTDGIFNCNYRQQAWMAENLKYLPSVIEPTTSSRTIPYYYVYGNIKTDVTEAKKTEKYSTYGELYHWPAAMNGEASSTTNPSRIKGVCPTGWHLPSDAEWTELTEYLGGLSAAGGKLKETGTTHWLSPNEGATNEIGFTALPGGGRYISGQFSNYGKIGLYGVQLKTMLVTPLAGQFSIMVALQAGLPAIKSWELLSDA